MIQLDSNLHKRSKLRCIMRGVIQNVKSLEG